MLKSITTECRGNNNSQLANWLGDYKKKLKTLTFSSP